MELCSVCGRRKATTKLKTSENFVSFPSLFHGTGICNVCAELLSSDKYRKNSWLLVGDEARLLGKSEVLDVLRNPPPGSVVYVKSTGRKYGFLEALRFASTESVAVVAGEDEGYILVPRQRLTAMVDFAVDAYRTLKRKAALLDGCSTSEWVHEELCRKIEEVRGDPLWRIVVRAL
ncbi:MAG: hypothetical protein JHC26_00325 [Thermofilum sp.]|uniref:hypothetical protein n=1 Tax=Thermofilum sp. TaxID=1961369 RepID=UPI00258B1EA2|nr:hypothetical protein [Thermofilum sp.]MCI4407510.1 hypothetical protein [Thermofilum sp.]